MKAIAVNKNKSQIGGDQMVRQELSSFEATIQVTGLELAFIKLMFGKVTGSTTTSIRKEADDLYRGAKKTLEENHFPHDYTDLQRILKVEGDCCCDCEDLPERL